MRIFYILCVATLLGCGGGGEVAYQRVRMSDLAPAKRILLGTDAGALTLSAMPVVFFDNASGKPATVVVSGLPDDPTVSPASAGFVLDTDPSRAVAGPIPPGGFAAINLITPGRYAYEVWIDGAATSTGELIVEDSE